MLVTIIDKRTRNQKLSMSQTNYKIRIMHLVFFILFVIFPSWALGFQFYINGQPASQNIQRTDLIKSVESKSVKVHDIHEDREIRFTGLPLRSLIAHYVSQSEQTWDQIQFLCADGYKPIFDGPVVELYDGYLAYTREGGNTFTVLDSSRDNRVIDLAPYYMVWDNFKNPELANETGSLWAYQVIGLDLISIKDKYSK